MILHRQIKIGCGARSMAQMSTEIGLGNSAQTLANLHIHSWSTTCKKEYAHGIRRRFILAESLQSPQCLITIHSPCTRSDGQRSPSHIIQPPRHPFTVRSHPGLIQWPSLLPPMKDSQPPNQFFIAGLDPSRGWLIPYFLCILNSIGHSAIGSFYIDGLD